jgi:hypothetical protein
MKGQMYNWKEITAIIIFGIIIGLNIPIWFQ